MTELEHLVETANHGLKALAMLSEKYIDKIEWREGTNAWTKITKKEIEQREHIEIRIAQK